MYFETKMTVLLWHNGMCGSMLCKVLSSIPAMYTLFIFYLCDVAVHELISSSSICN